MATVDSFQGGERDIIVLSAVRTDQMGFVDDIRSVIKLWNIWAMTFTTYYWLL